MRAMHAALAPTPCPFEFVSSKFAFVKAFANYVRGRSDDAAVAASKDKIMHDAAQQGAVFEFDLEKRILLDTGLRSNSVTDFYELRRIFFHGEIDPGIAKRRGPDYLDVIEEMATPIRN